MTNQNNEFGKSPVKLSSPTQIWIDDANQNNELDRILIKLSQYRDETTADYLTVKQAKQRIEALYAPKPVEKVNKTPNSVDLSAPKVNLIDIASPNMTPEASKAVDDALERSMEKMRATPESNESKMVTIAVDKNLIPTVWCDPEIADLVTALNLAEIPTIASCSGHGLRNGNIALEDGRELIIAENFEEARRMENAIELAENIRLTRAEPVENGELESLLHINGCQQRTAGYNEAKDGKDIDTDDVERLEKIAYDEVLNILAQEKAKWDTELIAEFEKLLEEVGRTSYKSPVYNHIENKVAKLRAKLLDKENV